MSHYPTQDPSEGPQERYALDAQFVSDWKHIEKALKAHCRHRHSDIDTELLASSVKEKLLRKFRGAKITEFNLAYAKLTAQSAARDIRRADGRGPKTKKITIEEQKKIEAAERIEAEANAGWGRHWDLHVSGQTVSLDALREEYGWEPAAEFCDPARIMDTTKIIAQILARCGDARCRAVIEDVHVNDADITSACRKMRISPDTFYARCRAALEGPEQLDIFGEVEG